MSYEPVLNPPGEPVNENAEAEDDVDRDSDHEANELEPLVPTQGHAVGSSSESPSPRRKIFGGLFSSTKHSHSNQFLISPAIVLTPATPATPATPVSSDGVFANIPAKPTSSRERLPQDEELGEEEWIFMTTEQRKKLAPPKYNKVKRDRAPTYTTEYTPPQVLLAGARYRKSRRGRQAVRPRINSLPAGSSWLFVVTATISTLLPFLGYSVLYLANQGRWTSHATRLGSRTGLCLGFFHIGAMMLYIPALVQGVFPSSALLLLFLLWTVSIGIFGWRLSLRAMKEYSWLKAQERVLLERIVRANLVVTTGDETEGEGDEDDAEIAHSYIEGTDMRVRDLKKALARARDARLARSLRAAGF